MQATRDFDGIPSAVVNDAKPLFEINSALQVRIPAAAIPVTYYCKIQDLSKTELLVTWPTDRGIRIIIRKGQTLDFYFVRNGMPNHFIGFVEETVTEPLPLIRILLKGTVSEVQRRQNYRVKCLLPIEIVEIPPENTANASTPVSAIRTVCTDLSAGGISFRHANRFPEGVLLNIKLSLPDNGPAISIRCIVIYSEYISEQQILYRTALRYVALAEGERSRIVRFIYRTQLQGLRP